MSQPALSFSTRKALCVQLGEDAGKEIADLLQRLVDDVEGLERTKVDVTPVIRVVGAHDELDQVKFRRAA